MVAKVALFSFPFPRVFLRWVPPRKAVRAPLVTRAGWSTVARRGWGWGWGRGGEGRGKEGVCAAQAAQGHSHPLWLVSSLGWGAAAVLLRGERTYADWELPQSWACLRGLEQLGSA